MTKGLYVSLAMCAVLAGCGRTPATSGSGPPAGRPPIEHVLTPFQPTPPEIVDEMLKLAGVTKDDVVYDLGSGDGRIVIAAAKQFGARGVGIEFDGDLVRRAREEATADGVEQLARFRQGDALQSDFSEASVVTLYMLPEFNRRLRPLLQKQLKPGTRIVSLQYDLGDWPPHKTVLVKDKQGQERTLFFWKIESAPGGAP